MTTKPEFEIQPDADRNLIRLRFWNRVTAAGLTASRAEIERVVELMRPGFTVLTDLTDLESMELDCVGELTRSMDLFRARGIGAVIRVIPDRDKDIGFNILSIIHYRGGVKIVT